jgi:predicted RNA-binding protein
MKNPLSSLEFMISNKITVIGLWGIGIILLFYSLNVNTIKRIHSDYEKDQANTIEEKEKRIETLEGINRLLTRNTHLIGTKLLCISAVIPVTNNNKLAAISDENESVYARSRMNGILKSIISDSTNPAKKAYYITDYPVLGEKIPFVVYCQIDIVRMRQLRYDTPLLAIFTSDNTVLQAFTVTNDITKDEIDIIRKIMITIIKYR